MNGPRPVQAPSDRQMRQTIRDELRLVFDVVEAPTSLIGRILAALDRLDAADSEETE